MNTSNQQNYGVNAHQTRSDLLSGLRTEGLGLGSVFPSQTSSHQPAGRNGASSGYQQTAYPRQQQQQQQPYQQLQSNAYRTQDSLRDISVLQASLEDQLAALRLQSSHSYAQQDAQPNYQGYHNGFGNQQQQQQYANQQHQHQQQYMQMQLQQQLSQQQAAVQQQKMELLRLQALQKQQQQQQHLQYGQQQYGQQQYGQQQLAAQQRLLLSQLQGGNGEYDGGYSSAASAQEQRQAAQASIQASLRQRQVQQLYQTIGLESDTYQDYSQQSAMQQQQQQSQQQLQLQNILNRHTRKVSSEGPSPSRTPLDQRSWRGGAVPSEDRLPTPPGHRGSSPASSVHSRKAMRPCSGTAESIQSMRSRTVTPSIVIDDSASEGSRAQSESDRVDGDQTPETSEEDLEVHSHFAKALSSTPTPQNSSLHRQGLNNGRYGSLGRSVGSAPTSTSTTPPITAPKAIPRAIHLSAAPQHRAFKTNASSPDGNQTINNAGLTLPPIQPRRQPKGQPNDFEKVNFQARMNSRLRKDAMSKLCASPRAASFGGNGMSFGARLSSAGSSVRVPAGP